MGDEHNQRAIFEFLQAHYRSKDPFTRKELEAITDWKGQTFRTYWTKWLESLLVPVEKDQVRVSESFRAYSTWESFRALATQVRRVSSQYKSLTYDNVIIYEFFMPLTNEGHLRTALDSLFYKDTILLRLRTLERHKLEAHIPRNKGEPDEIYLERLCKWVSTRFGGYSISHVSGRFKAAPLATMEEVAAIHKEGGRYLIDETTAVVRFIFPCGKPKTIGPPLSSRNFEDDEADAPPEEPDDAKVVRWFFGVLFIQSIIQVVNGEDEIWMVESGMRDRLHIWRIES